MESKKGKSASQNNNVNKQLSRAGHTPSPYRHEEQMLPSHIHFNKMRKEREKSERQERMMGNVHLQIVR